MAKSCEPTDESSPDGCLDGHGALYPDNERANKVRLLDTVGVWVLQSHLYCSQNHRLTYDLIDAGTEESELAVYTITMKRLSPMLILRVSSFSFA